MRNEQRSEHSWNTLAPSVAANNTHKRTHTHAHTPNKQHDKRIVEEQGEKKQLETRETIT